MKEKVLNTIRAFFWGRFYFYIFISDNSDGLKWKKSIHDL